MMTGRFAQFAEAFSILLIVAGIFALCQPSSFSLYQHGLAIIVSGWIGFTIWSHRRPIPSQTEEGNPQITIDGHPPIDVTVSRSDLDT